MTGLHYEMLEILAKRADVVVENKDKKSLVYKSTGSSVIDNILVSIVNNTDFDLIKAKIKVDIKLGDYADALIYAFQQINECKTFDVDEVFIMFNEN
jgi:hypothetical protein